MLIFLSKNEKLFNCKILFFNDFEGFPTNLLEKFAETMPLERFLKFKRFLKLKNRLTCVISFLLIKFGLKFFFNFNEQFSFSNLNNKPGISNHENFKFSLSHTKSAIVVAFANQEVGIDIELIKPIKLNLATKILSKNELKAFNNSCDKTIAIKFWTAKESFVKLNGNSSIFSEMKKIDSFNLKNVKTLTVENNFLSLASNAHLKFKLFKISSKQLLSNLN